MRDITLHSLALEQIDQAYPLIQTSVPGIGLEAWRTFAGAKISTPADAQGIICAVAEQNYIAGICIYRIEDILGHGLALIADHFMALDLFDRTSVAHALAQFMEDLGRRQGCSALHTHIAEATGRWWDPSNSLARILRQRGHGVESLLLCKELAAPR